jgi:hypothetical protein
MRLVHWFALREGRVDVWRVGVGIIWECFGNWSSRLELHDRQLLPAPLTVPHDFP